MFRGINSTTLDAKGRMGLSARFKDSVTGVSDGQVVVTIDLREPCLLLYPLLDWEALEENLQTLSNVNEHARIAQRLLIGHACDLQVDGAGRVLLPPMLRAHAQLDKSVVLVGQGRKIEVWSEALWNARMGEWKSEETRAAFSGDAVFEGLSI